MILHNVNMVGNDIPAHIRITGEKIGAVTSEKHLLQAATDELSLEFSHAIAFPGLINSHDHLDFNLFPQLGNHCYNNYSEWGKDIHENNKDVIDEVLKVPKALRIRWGLYKNLFNGITTVVNHGELLEVPDDIITVHQYCHCLHSIAFEKDWKYKLNRVFTGEQPYVIHIGEGTDSFSKKEIDTLLQWNFLQKKLIGVHGVAMNKKQGDKFYALVWCPASNYFLLNATAPVNELKQQSHILFGSDSTLTSGWNFWEQLRLAREQQMLSDTELLNSVTSTAAAVWQLDTGVIAGGKMADIVIATSKEKSNSMESFYSLDPEDILLVIRSGNIVLFDDSLQEQLSQTSNKTTGFSEVLLSGKKKWVKGNLPALIESTRKYTPYIQLPFA